MVAQRDHFCKKVNISNERTDDLDEMKLGKRLQRTIVTNRERNFITANARRSVGTQ